MAAAAGTHLVDAQSLLAATSDLDFFSVPPTQISISSGHWACVQSKNNLDDNGPWSFELNSGPFYVQLAKNYLYLKIKLVRADDSALSPTDDKIGPINLFASTFFKSLRVYLGSKLVSDSGDLYAYRSILETELNFDASVKEAGHLKAALYSQDRPYNHLEDFQNEGLKERVGWFPDKNEVELMAPLHADLFNSQKLLPTNCKLRIELSRNDPEFFLQNYNDAAQQNRNYVVKVVDMKWYIRLMDLARSAHLAVEGALVQNPIKIPIRRVQVTRLSVPRDSLRTPHSTIFNGEIPRRVVVGMVERSAFIGSKEKNPFCFKPFNLKEIYLNAGGVIYPRDPLQTDFPKNQFFRSYLQLLESMGMGYPQNNSCAISPQLYKTGMCLFAFDLTPSETDGSFWDLSRQGPTTLEATFSTALPQAIEVIIFAEFDGLIRVDRNREAHLNYMV